MNGRAAQIAENIDFIVLDVDGVMTDGTLFYGDEDTTEVKSFNVKDGLGIKLLQRYGIEVVIITGRRSSALEQRAAELGIETLVQGREDKGAALQELLDIRQIAAASVAYMGDDLPDLGAIRLAGLSACPSDAATKILESVDWVAPHAGGRGAVRALADFILGAKGHLSDLYGSY